MNRVDRRRRAPVVMPRARVDATDDLACAACGHDHAPGTTCALCGHHRRGVDEARAGGGGGRGRRQPIVEVIDKFLCLGAFEHTSKEDVLLACGIRTVMNVRDARCDGWGGRRSDDARDDAEDGTATRDERPGRDGGAGRGRGVVSVRVGG